LTPGSFLSACSNLPVFLLLNESFYLLFMMSAKNFYKDLPALRLPITDVFQKQYFTPIPSDWYVIISDIKNSTGAVSEGRHNDVNLVAAGSLIASLNVAKGHDVEIPFFFTGDGGTVLVPSEILSEVLNGLFVHNQNSIKNFNLELHIGSIGVSELMAAGNTIELAKIQFGSGFNKPVMIGNGLRYAEEKIKSFAIKREEETAMGELNLQGLECRWDKVKPPNESIEIVCYIIESSEAGNQMDVYKNVLLKIDEIYGTIEKRNPLSLKRMKLLVDFQKLRKEMMVKYGKWKTNYFTTTYIRTLFGKLFFRFTSGGKSYLNDVISNADTLIIDGRISTIISGKKEKRIQFLNYLQAEEKNGRLIFGHHISRESIMTCYVENRYEKHTHFIDGSDGGYTEASKEFKKKLRVKQQHF
jgi:hypothetical protein